MELTLPKGMKADITSLVEKGKASSNNAYVVEAVKEKYFRDTGEVWKCEKE
jgi:Arc/MetJ-type ribon-helix-helix transcriptional regulator